MERLLKIHAAVDAEAARLTALPAERLQGRRGCAMCCVDGIEVHEVEAERIRAHHGQLLRTGSAQAPGMCAFLSDEGACRIYADRPYVCRSQGLPLRWIDDGDDSHETEPVERRDICPLNEVGPALESLPADHCWSLGWAEGALAQLQAEVSGVDPLGFDDDEDWGDDDGAVPTGPAPGRVALRDLFATGAG